MIFPGHKRFLILSLLVLCGLSPFYKAHGQNILEILNSDFTTYEEIKIGLNANKLLGNVRLKHDDVIMSCDSAYFYTATSSVDAFSNVRVQQGDTLTLTGDLAHYDGTLRLARVRNNVKLVNSMPLLDTPR